MNSPYFLAPNFNAKVNETKNVPLALVMLCKYLSHTINSMDENNKTSPTATHLFGAFPEKWFGVVSLPGSFAWSTNGLTVFVSLSKPAMLLASTGQTAELAMLVLEIHDPVDCRISADGLVSTVNHDHFIIFVSRILSYPVGVQDSQWRNTPSSTLLSNYKINNTRLKAYHSLHIITKFYYITET